MSRGTTADHSDRRRRVIIMQSEEYEPAREPTVATPPRSRDPKPRRLRESELPESLLGAFRRACGQTVPLLIRICSTQPQVKTQTILWDRPSLLIGRGEECDLRLSHAEVSRLHAFLQIVNGQVHCTDLDSTTGTHWSQGTGNRQQGILELGETVSIGPYSLTLEPAPQLGSFEQTQPSPTNGQAIPEGLFLDFRGGDNPPHRWPATRDVTIIGMGSGAKIKLIHGSVSKAHCAIIRAGHALWVVDLHSDEGTLLNGKLVTTARLESGDQLQIGRFEVAVHYGSPLDDESIEFAAGVPARSAEMNQLSAAAEMKQRVARQGAAAGGVSEQFVLDVINQLGVMQQQALQQAQQSMTQAVQAIAATYQGRIEALENEHASLKRQLRGLPGSTMQGADVDAYPAELPEGLGEFVPIAPLPPNMVELEFQDLPKPEHGSYECEDPAVREQWLRDKMKVVEAELDKTRQGWGKKLIDLMGY